jgi:hypothetical protein
MCTARMIDTCDLLKIDSRERRAVDTISDSVIVRMGFVDYIPPITLSLIGATQASIFPDSTSFHPAYETISMKSTVMCVANKSYAS